MNIASVAVLRGGPSVEHAVSMKTGAGVLAALKASGVITKDITITKTGQWLCEGFVRKPEDTLCGIDVVFIALHGAYGEDGTVQRILERLSIPYTGSSAYASAIAMNKELTKNQLQAFGVKTPKHLRVKREQTTNPFATAIEIGALFGSRYIVKPTSGGSSIGTQIAHNVPELGTVLRDLLAENEDLLVEEYIEGKEATVGILENYRDQAVYVLPVIEIVPPTSSGFFAADVKYSGVTEEICPGRFKKEEKEELSRIAKLVHQEIGLRHYSRSDFILGNDGIYFLEVNTLPGLTEESLFPKSIAAVGGSYNELVNHLITLAKH